MRRQKSWTKMWDPVSEIYIWVILRDYTYIHTRARARTHTHIHTYTHTHTHTYTHTHTHTHISLPSSHYYYLSILHNFTRPDPRRWSGQLSVQESQWEMRVTVHAAWSPSGAGPLLSSHEWALSFVLVWPVTVIHQFLLRWKTPVSCSYYPSILHRRMRSGNANLEGSNLEPVVSNPGQVKPMTLKLILVAS